MVLKDLIGKIGDSISGQFRGNTYYTVCKKSKPLNIYEELLENVRKKISEVAPDARQSLEKLLDRMKKLDYSLISGDIKKEYGYLTCILTEAFYYGILKGIDLAVRDNIYIFKNRKLEQQIIQERINNLKTALKYLASEDRLERFLKAYLKRLVGKFHNAGYQISDLLRIKDMRGLMNLLNNIETVAESLVTLADLVGEESERVIYLVKDLATAPESEKEYVDKYIEEYGS